jgi:serine/threonine protein kinase
MSAVAVQAPRFGKYSLVAKLATGGMAEIFLARLQGVAGFHKLVCIKRILPQHAKDKQFVAMFLAEAKIAAQIAHANVCQVFELGEIDGRYFIAMEYLEGVPLACFRRKDLYPEPPDPRLIAGLGIQACEGLHHAHQLKKPDGTPLEVVHRDVSGSNLFGTVDGTVKVLDFGIAKVQDASARTTTGSVKGTYAYMAPEQLRGERVDRRTDVFAMGIVLWELISQRHLFRRETDFLTFEAITSQPIPDVCDGRPEVPRALGAAIAKALSRDREARFPTTRALGEALGAAVGRIGGPLPSSAIGNEILAAFGDRLGEQRALIRIANEGGALPLDDDIGPQVGHGTELLGTPVSIVSGLRPPTSNPRSNPISGLESQVVKLPSRPPSASVVSGTAHVQDRAPLVSKTALWIAAMIIVAVAAAAIAVFVVQRDPDRGAPPPPVTAIAAAPESAPAPAPELAPAQEPAVMPAAVVPDAAVAPPDARVADVPTPPDTRRGTTTRKDRRRSDRSDRDKDKDRGPPGFITIDSAPVYAVIYIDGKKYGETPLVKLSLSPGKHAVRAVSPSGSTRHLTIRIESGKVSPARRIEW